MAPFALPSTEHLEGKPHWILPTLTGMSPARYIKLAKRGSVTVQYFVASLQATCPHHPGGKDTLRVMGVGSTREIACKRAMAEWRATWRLLATESRSTSE